MYRPPDALYDYWAEIGIDLSARHGNSSRLLPLVATFIADRTGRLRLAYASGDIADRLEPETIVEQVRKIATEDRAADADG